MPPPLFFDVPPELARYETSRFAVLPVPFERTTSYGRGTAAGPAAILEASQQVELFEEMSASEPFRHGIATLPSFAPRSPHLGEALAELHTEASRHLEAGKRLVTLGGEHSLTLGPVRAAVATVGELGVVQFDAHADLRDTYGGTPHSHACIMRRIRDLGLPTLAVGIRALCREEAELIDREQLPTLWGWELEGGRERFGAALETLPPRVYVTFDMDFLDPSVLPATGTPVPGGGTWYPTLELLQTLFRRKEVVAMDVVELAPDPHHPASDFLAASLVYKCLGFWELSRG